MSKSGWVGLGVVAGLCTAAAALVYQEVIPQLQNERKYQGKPVSQWVEQLKHQEVAKRFEAADVMWRIGPVPSAVPDLHAMLNVKEADLRRAAAIALGRMGESAEVAIPQLREMAARDKSAQVREAAVSTLGVINRRSKETLTVLLNALDDRNRAVRGAATKALAGFGPGAIPPLEKGLTSFDSRMRRESAFTLSRMGRTAKIAIPGLLSAAKDKDREVRSSVINALGEISDGDDVNVASALQGALADPESQVRRVSIESIGLLAEHLQSSPLAAALVADLLKTLKDENSDVREAAATTLGGFSSHGKAIVPALVDSLSDEDSDVRVKVLFSLQMFGAEAQAAIPTLRKLTKDQDSDVRRAAKGALKEIRREKESPYPN